MAKGKPKTTEKPATAQAYRKFRQEMKKLDGSFVTAGIHEDAGSYPDGTSVAFVAAANEFGFSGPARPFLATAVETNRKKLERLQQEELSKIMRGESTVEQSLDRLGFALKVFIEKRIQTSNSWAAPNAPSTAARKKKGGAARGATPLIMTTLMLRSVGWKTQMKGRGK
jgi:hypothetical protein